MKIRMFLVSEEKEHRVSHLDNLIAKLLKRVQLDKDLSNDSLLSINLTINSIF